MNEIWTDPELKRRADEWKANYDKLTQEIDFAMAVFIKNRKCKCKVYEGVHVPDYVICRHWKNLRDKVFGARVNESFNKVLSNGFETFKRMGYFGKQ